MKNYFKLLTFLQGYRKKFALGIILIAVSSLFEGVQFTFILPVLDRIFNNKQIVLPNQLPSFAMDIVDRLNKTDVLTLFWSIPFIFLFLFLIKQVILFLCDYLMNDVSQSVMRDVRIRLFDRIQTLSLDYFSKKRTGELVSRITNDVAVIENAVSYAITDLFKQPLLIVVFLTMAFVMNTKGTIIVFIMIPLIGWPMAIITKRLRKLSRNTQEKMADINSHLLETISGVRILKAFGTERYEIERFRQQNQSFYRTRMKSLVSMNIVGPITEIVGAVAAIAVVLLLGQEVLKEHMSTGVFFLSCLAITQVIKPIKRLANVNAILQQAIIASDRIYEVLDMQPTVAEAQKPKELPALQERIVLEDVHFSYDKNVPVLEGVNLEIKKGQLVAIVGPTGSGKSTLVNLIPRFYDATQGKVMFDGVDVRDVSFKSLRSQVGIVTQEAILFNDTVRSNIAYGTFDVSDDQVKKAAAAALAAGFVEKMPKGYETVIGDRGFRLSGGEKQRLTIARAILKNAPILILDEATSSLDSESEKFVQQALDQLMQGRTVIAIAHRLSTIMKADKIVVLQAGKVVGMGQHDELLFTCALYRRLYETQFNPT